MYSRNSSSSSAGATTGDSLGDPNDSIYGKKPLNTSINFRSTLTEREFLGLLKAEALIRSKLAERRSDYTMNINSPDAPMLSPSENYKSVGQYMGQYIGLGSMDRDMDKIDCDDMLRRVYKDPSPPAVDNIANNMSIPRRRGGSLQVCDDLCLLFYFLHLHK